MTKPDPKPDPKPESPSSQPPPRSSSFHWVVLAVIGISVLWFFSFGNRSGKYEILYSQLLQQLDEDNIKGVDIQGRQLTGHFRKPVPVKTFLAEGKEASKDAKPIEQFTCHLPPLVGESLLEKLTDKEVSIASSDPADMGQLFMMASLVALVLMFLFGWMMLRRTRDQMMGGGMLSGVTKSPARRYDDDDQRKTFEDVAGLEGVKKDLQEIVQFLKEPEKFHRLGAQVPKGGLLMGPPGTGKTLLARAVAGEAGVPFFSINGSEFIQMFVGVGAGRVRDMFKTAKDAAPSILFIDEIDAIGRQRGAGLGGGHDEREQTLNQILSEMDGFSPTTSVIVLAATNRPDVLDPALLRPGRFDRHITVDRPTIVGRRELFELHSREVPIAEDVDFESLARATVGLTGADIRNLVNEAALWATRHDKDAVDGDDFEYARDKVLMGALREDILTEKEKEITAYHEAGHAVLAWLLPDGDNVHKVTIVPRGRALGVTQLVSEEERHNIGQSSLRAQLAMALGGRTAEKMQFDEYTAGAESDLQGATKLARRMVTQWGMSERLGPVAFTHGEENPFLGREMATEHRHFSERTAQTIDEEIASILHTASDLAEQLLTEHRDKLETLALALLDREILDTDDITELIGPSAHDKDNSGSGAAMDAAASEPEIARTSIEEG